MEAVKRDGKMNWKKVLPVVLWVGLAVFAIGAKTADGNLKRTRIFWKNNGE